MIINCNTSKMDSRMIKNVDLSEDDELIKQLTENTERAEAGVVDKGGSLIS